LSGEIAIGAKELQLERYAQSHTGRAWCSQNRDRKKKGSSLWPMPHAKTVDALPLLALATKSFENTVPSVNHVPHLYHELAKSAASRRLGHIDEKTGIDWTLPQGCGHDVVSQSLEAICAVLRRVSSTVGDTDFLLGGDRTNILQNQVRGPIERTLHYLLQGYQHVASEK